MPRWERTESEKIALAKLQRGWEDDQFACILEDVCVGGQMTVWPGKTLVFLPIGSGQPQKVVIGWMEETLTAATET